MKTKNGKAQITKTTKTLAFWTAMWLVSLALSTFGPKFLWDQNTSFSLLAIILNTAIGGFMIWANVKHLNVLDELQKKIQLEAMGIALGIGIVGGLSYSVLDIANVISGDAEIGFLVMLISVSYSIAMLIGRKRYA